ncbi:proliferating cell nuclear antigen (pcna) [Candidatus Woesearchaeota archaeon]|nr:proliferating cell nuclear antigen (pcna) [Candidatus Woesearchaeota archaeon]
MRLTLTEPRYLKDSILIISELVNEVNIRIFKDRLELVAIDPANVAMVVFKLLSSAFTEFNVEEEKVIGINLDQFTQILKRSKPTDVITLDLDEEKNRLNIVFKGSTIRIFNMSLLEIEDREHKVPPLKFGVRIETNTLLFGDAIEDMDVVADSLSFHALTDKFIIKSEGTTSSGKVEITNDEETTIASSHEDEVQSKYSIEYLKKIVKGSKLTNNVTLEFGPNYPLRTEYKVVDKLSLQFILAPRVSDE